MRELTDQSALNTPLPTQLEAEPSIAPRSPRRALTVMVGGALLSALCGVVQTLWIPRVLSVQAFGYWRMFLLYAGYAGLLHLGLVDGALLTWSDRSDKLLPPPIKSALGFLAAEHLAVLFPAVCLAWLFAPRPIAGLVLALAVYTLLFNLAGLAQVRLQTELCFTPVAFGMSAPSLLFVASFALIALFGATAGRFLAAYLAAWAVTAAILLWIALRGAGSLPAATAIPARAPRPGQKSAGAWKAGRRLVAAGWPIVLANTGFGLMQSADRVTVNLTRPIHDFAVYSLSQSTIYVPVAILSAVSRVAFSYFARIHGDGRPAFYRSSTRLLTLSWMLLLPYFFLVEAVVRRFLPRYIGGLPAGRILLLSVLFLSLIQIVQLNAYSLEGRQRQFFAGSVLAVAVALTTAWVGSRVIGTLTAVAWSQVLTAALWWAGNEWFLRKRTRLGWSGVAQVMAGFALSSVLLQWAARPGLSWGVDALLYLAVTAPLLLLLFPFERHLLWERL